MFNELQYVFNIPLPAGCKKYIFRQENYLCSKDMQKEKMKITEKSRGKRKEKLKICTYSLSWPYKPASEMF